MTQTTQCGVCRESYEVGNQSLTPDADALPLNLCATRARQDARGVRVQERPILEWQPDDRVELVDWQAHRSRLDDDRCLSLRHCPTSTPTSRSDRSSPNCSNSSGSTSTTAPTATPPGCLAERLNAVAPERQLPLALSA